MSISTLTDGLAQKLTDRIVAEARCHVSGDFLREKAQIVVAIGKRDRPYHRALHQHGLQTIGFIETLSQGNTVRLIDRSRVPVAIIGIGLCFPVLDTFCWSSDRAHYSPLRSRYRWHR